MGLLTKSQNSTLIQITEQYFVSKEAKLTSLEKIDCLEENYFSWGKFAEGKMPNVCITFLVKKKK